ncbi:MAG: hypothetical protein PVJ98_01290 [Akkermansiaceae bacterium]|jgi:hypothetical protein
MKNTLKFALTALLLAAAPVASASNADCVKIGQAVKASVVADSGKVLEIVSVNVAANPSCACEIVKAAIVGSDAGKTTVAKIVETAILEAPSEMRIIAKCAIATAPDAIANIQSVVEKYDAAGGEGYSDKGGLDDSKKAVIPVPDPVGPNPLDYPFQSLDDPIVKDVGWVPEFFGQVPEETPQGTPDGSYDDSYYMFMSSAD